MVFIGRISITTRNASNTVTCDHLKLPDRIQMMTKSIQSTHKGELIQSGGYSEQAPHVCKAYKFIQK